MTETGVVLHRYARVEPDVMPHGDTVRVTLHVDAATLEPLRTATVVDGNPFPYVVDRLPATPGVTAPEPVPDDYTEPA